MLLTLRKLAPLGLLVQTVKGTQGHEGNARSPQLKKLSTTTEFEPVCTANVTVYDTTFVKVTNYVDYTVTVNTTITNTCTEETTTILRYVVSVTDTALATTTTTATDLTTVTNTNTTIVTTTATDTDLTTVTNTDTDSVTVTTTGTDSTTVTTTDTDAVTITTTDTAAVTITTTDTDAVTITTTDTDSTTITTTDTDSTTITRTLFSTTYDPCPKFCSVSAETVNLYFWPTDRPYTYPTTYFDKRHSYTFTSPSVYMFIPTAQGINTLGQPAGPSTSSWILPLDLYDVSTIAGNATRQLTLADLGTNCPQTADPTAIATMVDSACDPVLAAPTQVRKWAYPCNACGRFGLFDPPYAVPTLTGGLVVSSPPPVTVTAAPITVTAAPVIETQSPPPPPAQTTGILLIEYRDSNANVISTATVTTTGLTGGTATSTVVVPASTTPGVVVPTGSVSGVPVPGESDSVSLPTGSAAPAPGETDGTFLPGTTLPASSGSFTGPPVSETSSVATAAGSKVGDASAGAALWVTLLFAVFWL
ncbi:hypothetical protein QBC35DRAFT_217239 [Podospora australis]|uniref:Uncharacterized protein n=1 Tax=Podospora australis TaxID=1536484 RepID=A0AAN7AJH9_9PEZI|nr:hypothetical protein QBC35DRAFT_217239 [Podospora australis]